MSRSVDISGRPLPRLPGPLAAALTTFLLVGLVLTGGSAARATSDGVAAGNSSRWLADQLDDDGTLRNPLGGTLPDYGLMIDVLFALHASGDGALADPIVDHLDQQRHASDYFTWDGLVPDQGYDAIIVGGAAAKVLVAAEVAGRDPRDFGGYDMVAETQAAIMRSGPDKGRISDYSKNPDFADFVSNNANMFGQSLAVIGLAGAGQNDRLAIDRLLSQQCAEGYFRIFFGYIATDETGDHVNERGQKLSTCDEGKQFGQSAPDGDTTGLALSALLAARAAGADGLDEPIDRTVGWLRNNQAANGGWGGGVSTEAPNTNSTGLIVQALADAGGAAEAVTDGTAYLRSAQVTADADADNALAAHIGAIAYTPEDYQAARTDGMVGTDTWIRATAQASLGLSQTSFHQLTGGGTPPPGPDPDPDPDPGPGPGPGPDEDPPPSPSPTPPPRETPRGNDNATGGGPEGPSDWPDGDRPAPPPPGSDGGEVVVPDETEAEPGSDTPAGRLGAYLAGQLTNGDHVEIVQDGETYVDYDATADLVLALRTLDEQPQVVARATEFLLTEDSINAYAHGAPYEDTTAAYAEPLAKLRLIAGFLPPDASGDDASGEGSSAASGGDTADDGESSGSAGNGDGASASGRDAGSDTDGPAGNGGTAEGTGSAGDSGTAGNGGTAGDGESSGSAGNSDDNGTAGDGASTSARDADNNTSGPAGNSAAEGAEGAGSGREMPSAQDRLSDALAALRGADGVFTDVGTYGDASGGTRRHAWATLATTADGGDAGAASLAVLIEAQRPDGTFPGTLTADDGDLFATALVVEALAGQARDGERADVTPERSEALAAAVAALNAAPGADGLVVGDGGAADLPLSAALAGARQAAGIDVSDTARSLGGLLGEDGGIGPEPGAASDLPTSIAVAPGVAGASWTSAPNSPVVTAGSGAVDAAADDSAGGPPGAGDGMSAWTISGLVAGGFAVAVALFFAVRHLIIRNKTRKAVAA
ncbi:hypothetical protein [Streptomyces sp. NBRC 109706]|uniref:hypothetical protein n=1 Tax=Streptomyces sp. NBRC 109706 TaxID=1550035 RepID=UPI00131C7D87|nr:hypothetical protein [Streptomyces sp. NBRC 109706]